LLELLIAMGILSAAVVFIFRAFTTSLSVAKFSQNIILATIISENKLYQIQEKQKETSAPLAPESGEEVMASREFAWNYETAKSEGQELTELKFDISWQENVKEKPYQLEFSTYLMPQR
jgi:type II secretion system protein I